VVLTGGGPAARTESVRATPTSNAMRFLDFGYSTVIGNRHVFGVAAAVWRGCCCFARSCRALRLPRAPFPCTDFFVKHPASADMTYGRRYVAQRIRRVPQEGQTRDRAVDRALGVATVNWLLIQAKCARRRGVPGSSTTSLRTPDALLGGLAGDRSELDPCQLRPDPQQVIRLLASTSQQGHLVGWGTTLLTLLLAIPCAYALAAAAAACSGDWLDGCPLLGAPPVPLVLLFLALLQLARQFGLGNQHLESARVCLTIPAFASPLAVLSGGGLLPKCPASLEESEHWLEALASGSVLRLDPCCFSPLARPVASNGRLRVSVQVGMSVSQIALNLAEPLRSCSTTLAPAMARIAGFSGFYAFPLWRFELRPRCLGQRAPLSAQLLLSFSADRGRGLTQGRQSG